MYQISNFLILLSFYQILGKFWYKDHNYKRYGMTKWKDRILPNHMDSIEDRRTNEGRI